MKQFLLAFVIAITTLISACNAIPSPPAADNTAPTQLTRPTLTPDPFPDPVLRIAGEEELVFDWTTDKCRNENIPDLPARAFRDGTGQVQLTVSHYVNYRMLGPDLDHVSIQCDPIFESQYNADPALFADAEWIESVYTEDGTIVYAIIHNEYHGFDHPGQCPDRENIAWWLVCWYNAETLAVSHDGGATYQHAGTPPSHLIASLPYPFETNAGPDGVMNASNIIKVDEYYYAFIRLDLHKSDEQRTCLMRTPDLADASAWRYWNGWGFVGQFVNPYTDQITNPAQYLCSSIDPNDIGVGMMESLTFNTYLNRYVLLGLSADQIDGREVWGIYYAFSDDLIHWKHRKLLREIPLGWTVENNTDTFYGYPVLLDPQSKSQNFDTTGKTGYVYYTRLNSGGGSLDRDLIRVPVEFFPSP